MNTDLVIKDLRVNVEDKEILKGLNLTVKPGTIHAIMGPNGSGKSTLAYTLMGHPGYTVTGGEIWYKDQNILGAGGRRALQARAVPGLPVSSRHPRRHRRELPALGDQRASRRRGQGLQIDLDPGRPVPQGAAREDGRARDRRELCAALPQRGLQRRREEADRDFADGDAQAEHGDHGRDQLGAGYRRAADRLRGREYALQPAARDGRDGDHALPAAAQLHQAACSCRCWWMAGWCARAARSWRWSWRRRATISSGRKC